MVYIKKVTGGLTPDKVPIICVLALLLSARYATFSDMLSLYHLLSVSLTNLES